MRLHTNDSRLGPQLFEESGHARNQPTAAHGNEHGIDGLGVLAKNLHGHGALACNHIRVVEGMNKGVALLLLKLERMGVGIGVGVTVEHHLGPAVAHRLNLYLWGGHRHDNHRLTAQLLGRQGHPLGMVARRGRNDAALKLVGLELGHLVVCPSELEGEDRLGVLALEQHPCAKPAAKGGGLLQRRLLGHVVDPRGQNLSQVIRRHLRSVKGRRIRRS